MSERDVSERLGGLEARLARLETLLGTLHDKLDRSSGGGLEDAKAGIQAWVTDYVSLRLQQLVPETCEHEPDEAIATEGPVLPGTRLDLLLPGLGCPGRTAGGRRAGPGRDDRPPAGPDPRLGR